MTPREFAQKEHFNFEEFRLLVRLLRSPEGCPWDREQTHKSLRNNFVEEAYEVCEGIDKEDNALLCEELGDVLLQVLFHAGIAEDEGAFRTEDVIDGVAKKMIRRHPHVFTENADGSSSEKPDWEEIKRLEKKETTLQESLLRISTALPSLKRAEKIIKKTKATLSAVEEVPSDTEKEALGKALFGLCLKCTEAQVDPEEALNAFLKNFIQKCTNYE